MTIDWNKYLNDTLYRIKVLREISKENEKASKAVVNNPEIQTKQIQLDKADKKMTEKRSADEKVAENYGDKQWAKLFGSHLATGLGITGGIYALPWISAIMTPSTYLDAIGAPSWIGTSANLGTSGYYTYNSGKEFVKNPNLENGIYTALSLIPATRANYSELGKVGNYINKLRLGTQLTKDIKNTKFTVVPIEHVSNKGITEGAGLRAASSDDVGFHFSPLGSHTTFNIQRLNPKDKFVRLGWWTYTNNNSPVIAEDKGFWTSKINPEFYKNAGDWKYPKLNNSTTLDALHASLRDTNYMYKNKYEGEENLSYMSTDPSYGIYLSKNIEAPKNTKTIKPSNLSEILKENELYAIIDNRISEPWYKVGNLEFVDINGNLYKIDILSNKIINNILAKGQKDITNFLRNEHEKYISTLSPLDRELYLNLRLNNSFNDNIKNLIFTGKSKGTTDEFTKAAKSSLFEDRIFITDSEEYLERIEKAIRAKYPNASDNQIEKILELITLEIIPNTIENTNYFIYRDEPFQSGASTAGRYIGLNNNRELKNTNSTLWHEFMHNLFGYKGIRPFKGYKPNLYSNLNKNIIGNPKNYFIDSEVNKEYMDYITNPNELHSRVMQVVREMIYKGIDSPHKAYYKFKPMIKDLDLDKFDKTYIIKLLGGLFATSPIININSE